MTRRAPYRCSKCGELSLLIPQHNNIAAGVTGIVTLLGFAFGTYRGGLMVGFLVAVVAYVFIVGPVMLLFLRLGPFRRH